MPENEERIGFEAYFETKEFEQGVKRWQDGIEKARSSAKNFADLKSIGKEIRDSSNNIFGALLNLQDRIQPIIAGILNSFTGGIGGTIFNLVAPILKAIDPLRIGLKALSGVTEALKAPFQIVGAIGSAAFKLIGVSLKVVTVGITALVGLVTGGLVAGFLLFRRTAQQAFAAITNKLGELLEGAVELQRIDVALEALVRTALVAEGSFDRASDAMGAAIPIASDLSEALQQMALSSPFTMDYINQIFRTNAAYGLSIDAAYRLTDAIIQVGAATGFSSSVLERIARNFAQVARNGRIWQRDIYELANAGLDMHRILDEELGMSVEQFNEGVQQGTVSVNDLIEALINFVSKNFEGSAEALAMTIDGLRNRFKTLGAVIVKDFVTPIIRMAAPALNTLFDALALVASTDVFGMFGQTVANMAQRVVGDIDWTTESIAQKIMDLLLWVANAARDFFRWGHETFIAWGKGALRGAATAISAVANFISRAISRLFSTHSPPEILPMIDVWGAETIEAWLEGMTHADFSILNDIVGQVESVLQALDFEALDIGSILQTMVKDVSLGGIENIFANITDQLGPFANALQELVDLSVDLTGANSELEAILKRVSAAMEDVAREEEILAGITKRYEAALKDVEAQEEVLEGILDRKKAAQKDVNAQEDILESILDRKKAAQKDVAAQEEILEEITDRQTEAQKALNEQEKILEDRTWAVKIAQEALEDAMDFYDDADDSVQRLVREYNALLRAGAGDDVLDAKLAEIKAMQLQRQEAANLIEDTEEQVDVAEDAKFAQEQVIRGYKDAVDAIKEEADAQRDIIDGYQDIVDAIEEEADAQRDVIDNYQDIVDAIEDEADAQRDVIDNYKDIADAIQDEIDAQQEVIDGYQEIVDSIEEEADAQRDIIDDIEDQINAQQDLIDLMLKLTGYTEDEDSALSDVAETLGDIEGLMQGLGDWSFEGLDTSALDSSLGDIGIALGEVELEWDNLVTKAEEAWAELTAEGGPFDQAAKDILELFGMELDDDVTWKDIGQNLLDILTQTITDVVTDLTGSETFMGSVKSIGKSIADGVIKGIGDKLDDFTEKGLKPFIQGGIDWWKEFLGIGSPSQLIRDEIGKPIAEGVIEGIRDKLEELGAAAGEIWTTISTALSTAWEDAKTIGQEVVDGLKAGISSKWEELKTNASETWENFKIGLGDFWTNAYDIGTAILQGLGQGIGSMFVELSAKAGEVWENFKSGFGDAFENAKSIGVSIIEGIKAGVDSMPNIVSWAEGVAGTIIQKIRNALKSNSPSEEAADEIGVPVSEGIFEGVNKGLNDAKVEFMMESPSKLMEEQVGIPLMQGVLEGFNVMKGAIAGGMTDMLNYTPTPTNSYTPSAITNNSIINNMYMGNNTVRSDMDIAIIENVVRKAIQNASHSL